MRIHVGSHILNDETKPHENLCGYCGLVNDICRVYLRKSSGSNTSGTDGVYSKCNYYYKFSLKPAKTGPCTNRPTECPECNIVYWSYNLVIHYENDHKEKSIKMISDDELILMNQS